MEDEKSVAIDYEGNRNSMSLSDACNCRDYSAALCALQVSIREINSKNNDGETPLLIACRSGSVEIVSLLINYRCRLDVWNKDGDTPLHLACAYNHLNIVQLLFKNHISPNRKNKLGETPLHLACRQGYNEIIALLCENAVELNPQGLKGDTPLHVTCSNGNLIGTTILTTFGARVVSRNKDKLTPLHVASLKGDHKIVEFLLTQGANVHLRDKNGSTPFLLACENNHPIVASVLHQHDSGTIYSRNFLNQDNGLHLACKLGHLEIIKFILASCDPNELKGNSESPLHLSCASNSFEITKLLLEAGKMNPNVKNKMDYTPLHLACHVGSYELVSLLISYGADIHSRSKLLQTPLHLACESGNIEIVLKLLELGVDINAKDLEGKISLHFLNGPQAIPIAKLFLTRGVDINSLTASTIPKTRINREFHDSFKFPRQHSPLHAACSNGDVAYCKFLLDHGADVSCYNSLGYAPYHTACRMGSIPLVSLLLDYGTEINLLASRSTSPIHLVCYSGHDHLLAYLSERGADLNLRHNGGETPLHVVCLSQRLQMIEYLLKKEVNANEPMLDGNTPLHISTQLKHVDAVALLIRYHGDVNSKNMKKGGLTPLHIASQSNLEIVQLLLENGADVNDTTQKGETALHLACKDGRIEIVSYLIEHGANIHARTNAQQPPQWPIGYAYSPYPPTVPSGKQTPLHFACIKPNLDLISLLLRHGADINCQNHDLETPLHVVINNGPTVPSSEVALMFIDAGARTNIRDSHGRCVTDLILARRGYSLVLQIIEKDINAGVLSKIFVHPAYQRDIPRHILNELRYHRYRRSWLYFLYSSSFLTPSTLISAPSSQTGGTNHCRRVLDSSDLCRFITEYL